MLADNTESCFATPASESIAQFLTGFGSPLSEWPNNPTMAQIAGGTAPLNSIAKGFAATRK